MANDTQVFNQEEVTATMGNVGSIFEGIGSSYATADGQMASQLSTPDGAIYGAGATKILSAWDENSGTLEDFMNTFDNWAALVSGMANRFTNLEEGTYKIDEIDAKEISEKARLYRTTALKTAEGSKKFNEAQIKFQTNAYSSTTDTGAFSLDENGLKYMSFKTVENGQIVETKVYLDEEGNVLFAETTHWDDEKLEYVTNRYEGGAIVADNSNGTGYRYDPTGATLKDEEEYKKLYYSDDNVNKMKEYWRNRYGADYLDDGQLSEEAQAALNRLPENVRNDITQELDDYKANLATSFGEREYDENGNIKSITYEVEDENGNKVKYSIVYERDEEGNVTIKYKVGDGDEFIDDTDPDAMNMFYNGIMGKVPPTEEETEEDLGTGVSGGVAGTTEEESEEAVQIPAATIPVGEVTIDQENNQATYSYQDENGETQSIILSDNDGTKQITIGDDTYTISYDKDGNPIYTNSHGFKVDADKTEEIDAALDAMAKSSPYAAALAGIKVDGKEYSIVDGEVISTQTIPGMPGQDNGELITKYNEKGEPTEYTYKNGEKEYTISADDAGMLEQGTVQENGETKKYAVDFENGQLVITTTNDESGNISQITRKSFDGGTETTTYSYDDDNKPIKETTIAIDKDGFETETTIENGHTSIVTKDKGGKETSWKFDGYDVSKEQLKNLQTGEIPDEEKGTVTRYTIDNEGYKESTYEGEILKEEVITKDNKTTTITQKFDDDGNNIGIKTTTVETTDTGSTETLEENGHTSIVTKDKGGKETSWKFDDYEVTKDQLKNLQAGELPDKEKGTVTRYTIDDEGYKESTYEGEILREEVITKDNKTTTITQKFDEDGNNIGIKTTTVETTDTGSTETLEENGHTSIVTKDKGGNETSWSFDGHDVSPERLKNLQDGTVPNKDGTVTEYTIDDEGKYSEVTKKDNKITKTHTEIGNEVVDTEYVTDKDGNPTGNYQTTMTWEDENETSHTIVIEKTSEGTTHTYDGKAVTAEQARNLHKGQSEDGATTYSMDGDTYTEITTEEGQTEPTREHREYQDGHSQTITRNQEDKTKITTDEYPDPNNEGEKHTFVKTEKEGKDTTYQYDGKEVNADQYDNLKTGTTPPDENTGEITAYSMTKDGFVETTYIDDIEHPSRVVIKAAKSGTVESDHEYTYDSAGNRITDTSHEVTRDITTTYNTSGTRIRETETSSNHQEGDELYYTQTTTYAADGETINHIERSGNVVLHNDTSYHSGGTYTADYEDGKIRTETITYFDGKKSVTQNYTDGIISERHFTYQHGDGITDDNTIIYTDGVKTSKTENTLEGDTIIDSKTYGYPDGKNKALTSREVTVDDITFDYQLDENGDVISTGANAGIYKDYKFTRTTIDEIADTRKLPVCSPKYNSANFNAFLDAEDNDGAIIVFEDGVTIQYDAAQWNMEGYEVVINMEAGSAYRKEGNRLVNINNPDEYYYTSVLKTDRAYNSADGNMTYEELQNIRENYGADNIEGYEDKNIHEYTIFDAVQNKAPDLNAKALRGFDTDNPINSVYGSVTKYDEREHMYITIEKEVLKQKGYIDDLFNPQNNGNIKINVNGIDFIYDSEVGAFISKDEITGVYYLYDPKNHCYYKSK